MWPPVCKRSQMRASTFCVTFTCIHDHAHSTSTNSACCTHATDGSTSQQQRQDCVLQTAVQGAASHAACSLGDTSRVMCVSPLVSCCGLQAAYLQTLIGAADESRIHGVDGALGEQVKGSCNVPVISLSSQAHASKAFADAHQCLQLPAGGQHTKTLSESLCRKDDMQASDNTYVIFHVCGDVHRETRQSYV